MVQSRPTPTKPNDSGYANVGTTGLGTAPAERVRPPPGLRQSSSSSGHGSHERRASTGSVPCQPPPQAASQPQSQPQRPPPPPPPREFSSGSQQEQPAPQHQTAAQQHPSRTQQQPNVPPVCSGLCSPCRYTYAEQLRLSEQPMTQVLCSEAAVLLSRAGTSAAAAAEAYGLPSRGAAVVAHGSAAIRGVGAADDSAAAGARTTAILHRAGCDAVRGAAIAASGGSRAMITIANTAGSLHRVPCRGWRPYSS